MDPSVLSCLYLISILDGPEECILAEIAISVDVISDPGTLASRPSLFPIFKSDGGVLQGCGVGIHSPG